MSLSTPCWFWFVLSHYDSLCPRIIWVSPIVLFCPSKSCPLFHQTTQLSCQYHNTRIVVTQTLSSTKIKLVKSIQIMRWDEMKRDEMRWDEIRWDDMAWHSMACHGMLWHSMAWHGMRWHLLAWHEEIWAEERVALPMMTSSNGNIFRVTDPLCKEFTGHRWIPHTKTSDHYDVTVMPPYQNTLTRQNHFYRCSRHCTLEQKFYIDEISSPAAMSEPPVAKASYSIVTDLNKSYHILMKLIRISKVWWHNSRLIWRHRCRDVQHVINVFIHMLGLMCVIIQNARPRFNGTMSSYQYRKPHRGDKTVVSSSFLHNGIAYTGKTASFCWINPLMCSEISSVINYCRVPF